MMYGLFGLTLDALWLSFKGIILPCWYVWILYLAVMNLKSARDKGKLSRPALIAGSPLLAIGLIGDFIINIFPVSLIFWEWPKWNIKEVLALRNNVCNPA